MTIQISCSGCGKLLNAKPNLAGKKVKCPKCKTVLLIPGGESQIPMSAEQELLAAIEAEDSQRVAKCLSHELLWLVNDEPDSEDDNSPIMAEVEGMNLVVAFTSQESSQRFADNNPEMCNAAGYLSAFQIHSRDVFDQLQNVFGLLLNPEDEDPILITPEWATEIGAYVQRLPVAAAAPAIETVMMPADLFPDSNSDPRAANLRQKVISKLNSKGFQPAEWLPLPDATRKLRSQEEIAARLLSLAAVFAWGSAPEDAVSSEQIRSFIKASKLGQWFTVDEQQVIRLPRPQAFEQYAGSVGWKLENMWSLGWVLGFEKAPVVSAALISNEITGPLVFEFVGGFDQTLEGLMQKTSLRSTGRVIALEDYFYCAHNAVRSAQVGSPETVPADFDPMVHGGAVHERRHGLTWCISPDVIWDETDLST